MMMKKRLDMADKQTTGEEITDLPRLLIPGIQVVYFSCFFGHIVIVGVIAEHKLERIFIELLCML